MNRWANVQLSGRKSLPNQVLPSPGAMSCTVAMATRIISTTVSGRYHGIRNGRGVSGWLRRSFHSAG